MREFNNIKEIISSDLQRFEKEFLINLKTNNPLLKDKINHLFEIKGKRVRPVLIYLIARIFGNPNTGTDLTCQVIEILHNASLVHDDVVDRASIRRGRETLNEKWDNKTAVLFGDYLFAVCIRIIKENSMWELLNIVSPVLIDLSYGELQQIEYNKSKKYSVDNYFEIINNKTASLMSVTCAAGAHSVGVVGEKFDNIRRLGFLIGQIFQISDDIIDYTGSDKNGKTAFNDIIEKKMTLPLILAIENAGIEESEKVFSIWNNAIVSDESIMRIRQFVKHNHGIQASRSIMKELQIEAIGIVKSFDKNKYSESLIYFINYLSERKK